MMHQRDPLNQSSCLVLSRRAAASSHRTAPRPVYSVKGERLAPPSSACFYPVIPRPRCGPFSVFAQDVPPLIHVPYLPLIWSIYSPTVVPVHRLFS